MTELIRNVESGNTIVDAGSFTAWATVASRLAAPPSEGETLTPITAHQIRESHLLGLLPGTRAEDLPQIRQGFARYLTYHAVTDDLRTWQDAWNAYTGATPDSPGVVKYRPQTCGACGGDGYAPRAKHRSDGKVSGSSLMLNQCSSCRGTGRPKSNAPFPALWISPPASPPVPRRADPVQEGQR